MARLSSIFGTLVDSKNLQLIINNSLDMFNVPQWKKYFQWGTPGVGLTYTSVIGAARIEAMASIVDRNSSAPVRSRAALQKLQGEIPAIKEKFQLDEKTYRDYMTIQGLPLNDAEKQRAALDILFNDVKKAGNAPHLRLDYLIFQMLSSAKVTISSANNPDGIITAEIDLLMPAGNLYDCVAEAWSVSATADPIADINKVFTEFKKKGITLTRMLMDFYAYNNMKATDSLKKYLYGKVNTNVNLIASLARINEFLAGEGLPVIELVDATMGIEADGVITTSQPWTEGQVTFLPAGPVGTVHNAIPIETLRPVEKVSYGSFERVLLSKWADNDPFAEYTQCELNAFPSWDNIDQCAILDSKTKLT